MINKKGFTLIELLSIIVILAVISVVTVPIVMNIVDESRKGTAKISAIGYKDAIMKYYVAGITDGSLTNDDLNGDYNVLNGVLFNTLENSTEYHLIPVTGEVPERENVSRVEKNDCIHTSNITARQLLYTPPEEVELDVTITNVQEAIDELVRKVRGN